MAMTRSVLFFSLLILSSALVSARSGVSEGNTAFAACVGAGKGAEVTDMAVAAEEGREFSIFLDSNRTTGYEWRYIIVEPSCAARHFQPIIRPMAETGAAFFAPPALISTRGMAIA
jgi:hypothetical protein